MSLRIIKVFFALFPAHAGVILIDDMLKALSYAVPRTCGGDPNL